MEAIITGYDADLNGTFTDSRGFVVSVPGALEGEKISYHIEHVSPQHRRAWARCTGLITASPDRVKAPCGLSWPSRGACAGCPLMHVSDGLQQKLKLGFVRDCLETAGIRHIREIPYHASPETIRYRNRTDLVFAEMRGRRVLGSYMARSHNIVPTKFCMVMRSPINQIAAYIVQCAEKRKIPAYKPVSQPGGALRYVSIFANTKGRAQIDLVCRSANGARPAWLDAFAKDLSHFTPVDSITWSINDSQNNAIHVAPSEVLWGSARIPEYHHSVQSLFAASGFTQLNTEIAAQIYETARDWFPQRPPVVWDLYCGAGAFGRTVHPGKQLFGAEFSASAIDAARAVSAKDPYTSRFDVMDLEKQWPVDWAEPDVILVDPPRKGLSRTVIEKLSRMRAPIVYMSCNPATFAQNVAALAGKYVLDKLEAFDMMPQTRHVELLGLLRHL